MKIWVFENLSIVHMAKNNAIFEFIADMVFLVPFSIKN
jgi:hypothetical protein